MHNFFFTNPLSVLWFWRANRRDKCHVVGELCYCLLRTLNEKIITKTSKHSKKLLKSFLITNDCVRCAFATKEEGNKTLKVLSLPPPKLLTHFRYPFIAAHWILLFKFIKVWTLPNLDLQSIKISRNSAHNIPHSKFSLMKFQKASKASINNQTMPVINHNRRRHFSSCRHTFPLLPHVIFRSISFLIY